MKQTLTLLILVLNLLSLCASQTVAQTRSRIGTQVPKTEEKTAATKLSDKSAPVPVNPPYIMAISGNTVMDLNLNGTASNFHVPKFNGLVMSYDGFAFGKNSRLYGLTSSNLSNQYSSYLFAISPNAGPNRHETLTLATPLYDSNGRWYCHGEGDLAYDNVQLYATCKVSGVWKLVTIGLGGNVTIIGSMPGTGGAFSALAFNSHGQLFALDTQNRKLWKLDKTNPSNNPQPVPLVAIAGQQLPAASTQGGMGFIGESGLYAFFGGHLVTINPLTGAVNKIANNGSYVSGLAVSGGGYVQAN